MVALIVVFVNTSRAQLQRAIQDNTEACVAMLFK
jgi:hypothetical protein